jgi:hypothetical protein
VADKSTPLILDALSRAVADPAGMPLFGNKARPGLFAATVSAREAAQHCKEASYLRVVGTEKRGKSEIEICAITEKGLTFLLEQVSPKPVLEKLVLAIQEREKQVGDLVAAAQQAHASLDQLKAIAAKLLEVISTPAPVAYPTNGTHGNGRAADKHWLDAAMAFLTKWQEAHPTEDCSLPELYRQAAGHLTIGEFHDGLRALHAQGRIYLHPWTGPLYDIPEPALVLMAGHEIAYYASVRK